MNIFILAYHNIFCQRDHKELTIFSTQLQILKNFTWSIWSYGIMINNKFLFSGPAILSVKKFIYDQTET